MTNTQPVAEEMMFHSFKQVKSVFKCVFHQLLLLLENI